MSADKVPGVKTVSGAPVRDKVTPAANKGAAALAAAVAKQKKARAAEMESAREETRQRMESMSHRDPPPPGTVKERHHLQLSAVMSRLNDKIDGQHLGKDVVARALRRRSMKLDDEERPLRLLFAGPSGVGKTAMATALCEALLGSCLPDRNFKRFNLSEFSHPSKFNRLTGGDPNYVGYKEGGELTNFIRNAEERRANRLSGIDHTSCVLLLDEVDRAAEGLLTFLMNFLDQGQLTSGAGDTVDARKAVVLMTTNCGREGILTQLREGSGAAAGGGGAGGGGGPNSLWDASESARRRVAIVESVKADVLENICDGRYENLGRLGTIVPFMPLQSTGRRHVIQRQLEHVSRRVRNSGTRATLEGWSEPLIEHLYAHWDDDTGGRSTRDFIEENVVEAIANALDEAACTGPDAEEPLPLMLDVEVDAVSGHDRVVCRPQT